MSHIFIKHLVLLCFYVLDKISLLETKGTLKYKSGTGKKESNRTKETNKYNKDTSLFNNMTQTSLEIILIMTLFYVRIVLISANVHYANIKA